MCRRRRPVNLLLERVRSDHQARSRTSLSLLFSEKAKTRLVFFTLSSLWSIITTCVSYSGWNRSRGSESASTWLSRSFCTTTQRIQLETELLTSMSEKMMEAVGNGCAWGLRDSHGSLLNRSCQVLTTSLDVQRVLNHRI